jgi:hypothetical protein
MRNIQYQLNCSWCGEPLEGIVIQGFHRECLCRATLGSALHQQQKCKCFGGIEEEDESLSLRESAIAAFKVFKARFN